MRALIPLVMTSAFLLAGNAAAQTFIGSDTTAGDAPSGIAALDADGDTNIDLAVTNRDDDSLTILTNDGSGSFTASTISLDLNGGIERPIALVAANLDNNARTDLAVVLSGVDMVAILQPGAGGDLEVTNTFNIGDAALGIAAGDLDGANGLDLVTANEEADSVSVLLNNGDGTFTEQDDVPVEINAQRTSPNAVAIGMLDGDANGDLVVALEDQDQVAVLLGNGDGTFGDPTFFDTGDDPLDVKLADFNEDGNLDIATANSISDDVSILLGNGDGTFGTKTDFTAGNFSAALSVADIDGDDNLDIATANGEGDSVSVLLGNGDGTFGAPTTTASGNFPTGVAIADFDGDNEQDLATSNQEGDTATALLAGEEEMVLPMMECGAGCGPLGLAPLALTMLGIGGMRRGMRRR